MAFACISTINSNIVRPLKYVQLVTGATGAVSDTTASNIRTIIYTTNASAGTGVVNVGTFTAGKTYTNVTILVVSGGGGGGSNGPNNSGGGGGGGAVITGSTYTINNNTVCNINVSTGGVGNTLAAVAGRNLHSSSIVIASGSILNAGVSVGSSITATNLGTSGTGTGGSGAGGGGGAGATYSALARGTSSGNSLGYNGGTAASNNTQQSTVACGGGGGSSAAGGNGASGGNGGKGGAGIAFNTTFLGDRRYGCGGGGSVASNSTGSVGAGGGSTFSPGGNGSKTGNGQAGAANTGMGGGGTGANPTNRSGGNGSNGVVIIQFTI
jgi:hypothetical protein